MGEPLLCYRGLTILLLGYEDFPLNNSNETRAGWLASWQGHRGLQILGFMGSILWTHWDSGWLVQTNQTHETLAAPEHIFLKVQVFLKSQITDSRQGHRAGHGKIFNGWCHQTVTILCPAEWHQPNGPEDPWSQTRYPPIQKGPEMALPHRLLIFIFNTPGWAQTHLYHKPGTVSMITIYLRLDCVQMRSLWWVWGDSLSLSVVYFKLSL